LKASECTGTAAAPPSRRKKTTSRSPESDLGFGSRNSVLRALYSGENFLDQKMDFPFFALIKTVSP
jgi:hypothetical protein